MYFSVKQNYLSDIFFKPKKTPKKTDYPKLEEGHRYVKR